MSAASALEVARSHGIQVHARGDVLLLAAEVAPPDAVIEQLKVHKAEILELLRYPTIGPDDAANIKAWLDLIGEHSASERAAVFAKCDADPQVRADVVELALLALSKHHSPAR